MYNMIDKSEMGSKQIAEWETFKPLLATNETLSMNLSKDEAKSLSLCVADDVESSIFNGTYSDDIFMLNYASKEQAESYFQRIGLENYKHEEV